MKNIFKTYLFYLLTLWLNTQIFQNSFIMGGDIKTYFFAAVVLFFLNLLIKPILKLLFFPINAITMGLFSLVINVIIFLIFIKLMPQIQILPWNFPGFVWQNISIPAFELNYLETILIISLFTSSITNFLSFLLK